MWSQRQKPLAFSERFADEIGVAILKVPQAAVDQPRRSRRCSARHVTRVDDADGDSVDGEVASNCGSVDSCPQDQDWFDVSDLGLAA